MPKASETDVLRPMVSGEDSRSGMCSPKTRSVPSAWTHSAAATLESMPPDRATTAPLRRVAGEVVRGGAG